MVGLSSNTIQYGSNDCDMSIYITGDTHADFEHRFNMDKFPEQREMPCVLLETTN